MSETLYNGIELPAPWPPREADPQSLQPMRVPYLEKPPAVIPIDGGRQLFVDDFLIAQCSLAPVHHQPVKYPANPVFFPQTDWERNDRLPPCTVPKCGGIWYDDRLGKLRMWYMASYLGVMAHAESRDGVHWERTETDVVPGSNLILSPDLHPDSGTVFIDPAGDPDARYKMLIREPNDERGGCFPARLYLSADGFHWREIGQTGPMDDRSTMFYNPFRKKWVQSIRAWLPPRCRCRLYWEHADFLQSAAWARGDPPFWAGADCLDEPGDDRPQLYNLDAVGYESLMLGLFQILKGPPNHIGEATGTPKLTELTVAFSRDGFHWHRPCRRAFIGARREPGSWERGYVESTGGVCLIAGDELWFYYSAYAGDPKRVGVAWGVNGMYANGAVGLAKLRRDGFTSLQARFPGAEVLTRPVQFSAGECLFVNANTAGAELRAEALDEQGKPLDGYEAAACVPFIGNSTCARLRWKNHDTLGPLRNRPVRFRFTLDRGDFYAFWVSPGADGASGGYTAAGRLPGLASANCLSSLTDACP